MPMDPKLIQTPELADTPIATEQELAGAAWALGASEVGSVSAVERRIAARATPPSREIVCRLRRAITHGGDPLGDAFCALRSSELRRSKGAVYTPRAIVQAMVEWAQSAGGADRVVDPGLGSGRFLVVAGRRLPEASLLGIEIDPLAALCARANLAVAGLAQRAEVRLQDYREGLAAFAGRTLFIGNPPYVRHHAIEVSWKRWLNETARAQGLDRASQLAGLHVHFFFATALSAKEGDIGAFITAAEWLDVNYGSALRELLLRKLGASAIHLIEPTAQPFADASATAAITCFEVGARPSSLRMRRVGSLEALSPLGGGRRIGRKRLEEALRWTPLTRAPRRAPSDYVELGELCRVHRGAVTGANGVWIAAADTDLPEAVLYPTVTRARELFLAGAALDHDRPLRRVVDLPVDLDQLEPPDRQRVEHFLLRAKARGADQAYVARKRRAWWSVELREPAPILATYMARRPPAFVRNLAGARHINIAHGLYPREPMPESAICRLARFLSSETSLSEGRTYAGGLTKFEPREMERLMVPSPELLLG